MYNDEGYAADIGGNFQFDEKSIRMGFIRKVYSLLMVQLTITTAVVAVFVFVPEVKSYSVRHPELWWISMALTFVLLIAMACCPNVRRNFPINIIMLMLFTICEGLMLGSVASLYSADSVLYAAAITAVVALGLTLFSFQTKWDFTVMGGFLFVAVIVLMFFGILAMIVPSKALIICYGAIGALIFSLYLVYDTQLMMGGKHKYAISPEEYIFGALNLYLDIINMFLFILTIFGGSRS